MGAQVSANYLKYIKARVMPNLGEYSGMALREMRTLACIANFETPTSGKKISSLLSYDPATVTRSTQWLLNGDFIQSAESEDDGRSTVFSVTRAGRDAAAKYRAVAKEAIQELDAAGDDTLSYDEIVNALAVIARIRDRSDKAAKLASKIKRKKSP